MGLSSSPIPLYCSEGILLLQFSFAAVRGGPGRNSSESIVYNSERRKCYDWRAPAILLGFEFLESLSLYGIATNLVIYLTSIIHESNTAVAASVANWTGMSFFTPILGALLADSYLGNYRTILFSSIIYLLGTLIVTLTAAFHPSASTHEGRLSAAEAQKLTLFAGLYLIAFGSGGVKSSLLPLGADQFEDVDPIQRMKKESFFSWFYFCINLGALVSSIVIVWIQENISWSIGYAIAAICMALAIASFLIGMQTFRLRKPEGSPLKSICQVLVASLLKLNVEAPTDASHLHEVQVSYRLAHTDEFRFLDKAAASSNFEAKGMSFSTWRLCTVTQVEELKILLRLFPVWLTNILYSMAYAQMYTTFIEQGRVMDTNIGFLTIPPASLLAFQVVSIMVWVLLYDKVVVVAARIYLDNEHGLTHLQRMGVGHILMVLTMVIAATVESQRLKNAGKRKLISILWQLPQYIVVGCSEVFCYIGQLEFFYDQGPDSMRSISTAISLLTISLGNYLNSLVVMLIDLLTAKRSSAGWILDDLNEGHLDYFFWLLAGICFMNFFAYCSCAKRYFLKRVIVDCPGAV